MSGYKWRIVPHTIPDEGTLLENNLTREIKGSKKIESADSITLSLKSLHIYEKYDKDKDKNDPFISTLYSLGSEPEIKKVHAYKENVDLGQVQNIRKDNIVFSITDFNKSHLTLNPKVYEIDESVKQKLTKLFKNDENAGILKSVGDIATGFYPILGPYIPILIGVAGGVIEFMDKIQKHAQIIDDTIVLHNGPQNQGEMILQTGHYVFFKEEQSEDGLKMNQNQKIINSDGSEFTKCSYIVYTIKQAKMDANTKKQELDHKMATLLTQIQEGNKNNLTPALTFLENTIEQYNTFQQLKRKANLKKKPESNRTDAEKELLKMLDSDQNLNTVEALIK